MAKRQTLPAQNASESKVSRSNAVESESDKLLARHHQRLLELAEAMLEDRTLILASNRGPVSFRMTSDGDIEAQRGTGGVVTAISAISNYANPVWVAAAMTDGDRHRAEDSEGRHIQWVTGDYRFRLRFVTLPSEVYEMYYGMIANPLLWFLQHSMWDAPRTPNIDREVWDAWGQGYTAANQAFADAILDEIEWSQKSPLVMLHDYHLYLCPQYLRPQLPADAILHQFIHIPWPGPDYWVMLPDRMRSAILTSLCQNDILGFQTRSSALNFLRTCESFLPADTTHVDYSEREATLEGHTVWVRDYPISIDVGDLRKMAASDEVQRYVDLIKPATGDELTIVRVDRAEPSKNIVRGFKAFELLLAEHPEYRGKIKFLAFLVPSRLAVEQYQTYLDEISGSAMWINAEYGTGDWQPVELFMGENYPRAIAAMELYDVLLVNPIVDGMNLVSKEGPTVNQRNGVLVLSEGAGSYEQLGLHAVTSSPYDIDGTAKALHQALQMERDARKEQAAQLRRTIAECDLPMWLIQQLEDIQALVYER
jgi:trehalose 6-phosphate synthase